MPEATVSLKGFQQQNLERELQDLEAQYAKSQQEAAPAVDTRQPVVEPVQTEAAPEVVEATETPQVESKQDIDFWMKEAETWKKRKADADRALTPTQQENAKLRKEIEHSVPADKIQSLEDKIAKLTEMISTQNRHVSEMGSDDMDDDFSETYPDIASRMKSQASTLETRLRQDFERKLAEIQESTRKQQEQAEQARLNAYASNHLAEVKRLHSDVEDFVSDKYGPALLAWANTQAPLIRQIVENPLGFTPQDVAYVISSFKTATGYQPKKPSLGDVAVKLNSASQVNETKQADWLTEAELANFDELIRRNAKNPQKMAELERKLDNTLNRMHK